MGLSIEDLKSNLAKLLWKNGFGDDPWRNWRMAELLIIDDGFLSWRRRAHHLQELELSGRAASPEYTQALNDFHTGIAYWIYAVSLGLMCPSHDPGTNWRIADALRVWFCTVDF